MKLKALILCLILVLCDCNAAAYKLDKALDNHQVFHRLNDAPLQTTTKTQNNGKKYKNVDESTEKSYYVIQNKLNWTDAKNACKKKDMSLATTTTYEEKLNLENYLRKNNLVPKDQYSGYWIGSHRLSTNASWIWATTGKEISSQFGWLSGKPTFVEGENCMECQYFLGDIGWNNHYCNDSKAFVCESSHTGDDYDGDEDEEKVEDDFQERQNFLREVILKAKNDHKNANLLKQVDFHEHNKAISNLYPWNKYPWKSYVKPSYIFDTLIIIPKFKDIDIKKLSFVPVLEDDFHRMSYNDNINVEI